MFNNIFTLAPGTASSTAYDDFNFYSVTQISADNYLSGTNTQAYGTLGIRNNSQVLTYNANYTMWGIQLGNVSDYSWTGYGGADTVSTSLYIGNTT
jgi:hypothetical protein